MSRSDNLWSQAVGYSSSWVLRLVTRYWKIGWVNLWYDPRRLKKELQDIVEGTMQMAISRLATAELASLGHGDVSLVVQAVEAVRKPRENSYTLVQDGLWLADALLGILPKVGASSFSPNFIFRDCTEIAREVLLKGQGEDEKQV